MTFNNKKKNYIYLSITMLLLSLYIVFFPLFAKALNLLSPKLTNCVYKSVTGKPCPLCGGTRYIAGIKDNFNNLSYFNNFFGYFIIFILFEIMFRIFCLIYINNIKTKNFKFLFTFDIIIHSIAIVLFILYEIMFFITN